MHLRATRAGQLIRNGGELELRLIDTSARYFADFMTVLPTKTELSACRALRFNLSDLHIAYPSTAAVLVTWFRSYEAYLDAMGIDVDYDPPTDDGAEQWLDGVGFTNNILNVEDPFAKTRLTTGLHEIPLGVRDASDAVTMEIDKLIRRNRLRVEESSLNSLTTALSEVVENIVRHADMRSSAFACAQVHPTTSKFSICIADAGIGILESFRNAPYERARERFNSGESPLRLALEPLMSSKYGMGHSGYGLFYASELCALSRGTFRITSGGESLIIHPGGRYEQTHRAWNGTIVQILLDTHDVIDGSKVWEGQPNYYEDDPRLRYINSVDAEFFRLHTFGARLLTRDHGADALRIALSRLGDCTGVRMDDGLVVSLDGIDVMTPSFADEFFGGLFTALGPDRCRALVSVAHADDYFYRLIEMVLNHRAQRE